MLQSNTSEAASNYRAPVLVAEDLQKSYGARPALRGLSFSLQAGRVLGFLGPNGAGKTTAIRILTTILEPSSGWFSVAGMKSEFPDRIRRKIGVLPESLGLPKQATGIEHLVYFGRLYGYGASEARRRGQTLLEEVGLDQRARSLIGTYSRGMRQRLGIARALVNDPVVVFFDEPTLGLDPRGQQELLLLVRRIAQERNTGVILCSHHLSDIEGICDDVVILNVGQVVANGSVSDVIGQAQRTRASHRSIRIRVAPWSVPVARQAVMGVSNVTEVTAADESAGWLQVGFVDVSDGNSLGNHHINNRILETLIRSDVPVLGLEAERNRLQDVFLQLTEKVIE